MKVGSRVRLTEAPHFENPDKIQKGEFGTIVEYNYSIADPTNHKRILNSVTVRLDRKKLEDICITVFDDTLEARSNG